MGKLAEATPAMIFRAQYEITDDKAPINALAAEGQFRFRTDVAVLGLVMTGPISDPPVIQSIGESLWLELEAPVRDAGQLIGASK